MVDGVERELSREGQTCNDGDRSGNGESGPDVSLTLSILCYAAILYCTASADFPPGYAMLMMLTSQRICSAES